MLYLIVCDITYYIILHHLNIFMYDCKNCKTYHVLYCIYIYIIDLSIHYILHMNVVFFGGTPPIATGNHQLVLSQKLVIKT